MCGILGVRGKARSGRWRAQSPSEGCVWGWRTSTKCRIAKVFADPRMVGGQERGGRVKTCQDHAILVGRPRICSHTLPGSSAPASICGGRDAKDASCGTHAQGWHARTTEMIRPNMKKRNSATSLLAACALSLSLSFNCETPPPEASFKNWSLSARKRNTPVRYGQARAQSRAQLGVCDGYHVRCRQSRAVHRRGNYYLSPPTLRSIFCCCLVDI